MKKISLIVLLAVGLVGCGDDKKAPAVSSNEVIISVNSALVCYTSLYGYVSEGSVLFNIATAVEGYDIVVKQGGIDLSHTYCSKNELQHYISLIRYKTSLRDSIISRNSIHSKQKPI